MKNRIDENEWSMKIIKVQNGFICKWYEPSGFDGDDLLKKQLVFEDKEDEGEYSELYSGEEMLWFLIEHFGLFGSKYDKKRLRVNIEEQKQDE